MATEREQEILDIQRHYACDRVSAEEILENQTAAKRAAYERAQAETPANKAAARAAYDDEMAKPYKNRENKRRRAIREAREIYPNFKP